MKFFFKDVFCCFIRTNYPYNPLAPILEAFTRPYLRPFARFQVGSVDLGPLVLLLILQLITAVPAAQLEMLLLSQLKLAV